MDGDSAARSNKHDSITCSDSSYNRVSNFDAVAERKDFDQFLLCCDGQFCPDHN
jgi:hypothetical protein